MVGLWVVSKAQSAEDLAKERVGVWAKVSGHVGTDKWRSAEGEGCLARLAGAAAAECESCNQARA